MLLLAIVACIWLTWVRWQSWGGDPDLVLRVAVWGVAVGILLFVGRRFRIRPPALFALYVSYYCFGRFFEELLRIDPAHEFLGLRINAWVSIVLFVLSTAFFIWWQFIRAAPGVDESPQG